MKHSEARTGRTFVIRLEDGDRLPDALEAFAREHDIERASCIIVGGIGGGRLVVGPEEPSARPVVPMLHEMDGVHEIAGVGMIFPSEDGTPRLHMHGALGRAGRTRTGCVRPGVTVWQVCEVVLTELISNPARRVRDPATGFELLEP